MILRLAWWTLSANRTCCAAYANPLVSIFMLTSIHVVTGLLKTNVHAFLVSIDCPIPLLAPREQEPLQLAAML